MNNNFYVIANNTDDEYYLSELASFIISGYECELEDNKQSVYQIDFT
mgnify:CR=1 FL=1